MPYMGNNADTYFTRGMIIPLDGDADIFTFDYNPKAVIRDKKIKWQHLKVAGRTQPFQQFGCGEPQIVIFPFSVARGNNGPDFVKYIQESLLKFLEPTAGEHVKRPPICQVILGEYLNLTCVVRDIKAQCEEFYDPINLLPTSAEMVITVEEYIFLE